MHLDLPTLMVMESFVAACSGAILLGAWLGNEKTPILGLWGVAIVISACGIVLLTIGMLTQEARITGLANIVLALVYGLMWKGARSYSGKSAPPVVAFLGALVLAFVGTVPSAQNFVQYAGLLINAAYLFAAAVAFWAARKPPLPARWPLIGFIVTHAVVMLIGAFSLFNGAPGQVPPLESFFGVIHFETIVFSVGTATLILALVKERSEAASKLIASIDSLTGISNRAAFMLSAERILARCRHDRAPVSVIMFDLDIFKTINDTHGHAVGDAVIRKFCEVAGASLRHSDVFGRIGGEEFAVVLPGLSIEPAYVRADRIRLAVLESCRSINNRQVNATVSGGVVTSPIAETTLSALLEQADEALYRAKTAGRNRIVRAVQPVEAPASSNKVQAA